LADFHDLARALIGAEVNCGADGSGAHVPGFLNSAEENLIKAIRVGEELVVIHLYDEGDFVGVFARDRAEDAKSRGYRVAAAFYRKLDDIFRVEIIGIFCEAGAGGVLDALITGRIER